MNREDLVKLKEKISKLSRDDKKQRDIYLRNLALGIVQGPLTGYPSIDKVWLKYYGEEVFNGEISQLSIYDLLLNSNKNNDNEVALYYFGKEYTYKELFSKIENVEKCFLSLGVKKGDIVTVAIPNIPENVFCFYALSKIGAIANMIDLRTKGDALVKYINEGNSKVMVASDIFYDNIKDVYKDTDLQKIIITSPSDSLPMVVKKIYRLKNKTLTIEDNKTFISWSNFEKLKYNEKKIDLKIDNKDPVCILHTSGTTGESKGVMLSHYAMNAMVNQYKYIGVNYHTGEKFMNQVPSFLAYNIVLSTHMPLSFGLKIVMLPNYEPEKFAEHIMKYKINHVLAGPADWKNFLDDKRVLKAKLSYLVTMGCGSDKLNDQVKSNINNLIASRGGKNKILEGYGMTELGSAACSSRPNCNISNSVGIPLANTNISIFEDDNECFYNQVGEIHMTSATMMNGYYGKSDMTEDSVYLSSDGNKWIRTGDLGYIDNEGRLYVIGRKKRVILRYDGIKVSPYEIENVIKNIDCIKDCRVVGIDDIYHKMGSLPCPNIIIDKGCKLTNDEVIELVISECRSNLSEKYYFENVAVIEEKFPLTAVGKVDDRALSKRCNELFNNNDKIKKRIKKNN